MRKKFLVIIILVFVVIGISADQEKEQEQITFINSLKKSFPELAEKIDVINNRFNKAKSLNNTDNSEASTQFKLIFKNDKKDLHDILKRYYTLLVSSPEKRENILNGIKNDFPNFQKFQSALKNKLQQLSQAENISPVEAEKLFNSEFKPVAIALPEILQLSNEIGELRLQDKKNFQAELDKAYPVWIRLVIIKIDKLDQFAKLYRHNPDFYEMCLKQLYPELNNKISKVKELAELNINDSKEFEKCLKEAFGDDSEIPIFFARKIRQFKIIFKNNSQNPEKELKKAFPYMSKEICKLFCSLKVVENARGKKEYEQVLQKEFPVCPYIMEQFVLYLSK